MATTKVVTVLMDNVTVTAGGSATSITLDLQDGYGAALAIKITNGATGPTVAAQAQIWISPDNSNYYAFGGALIATLGNNVVTSWLVPIHMAVKYVYVIVSGNTGQSIVARVSGTEVTEVS
jgi:hypothetical protein